MNAEEWVREWFTKADHDAEVARRALEDEPLPDAACFHAQQCTAKCLKGFLTAHEQVVEKTHDLTGLLKKCVAIDASFKKWDDACERLSGYAVEVRYPGDPNEPDADEAREAVEDAAQVRAFVRSKLDV